MSHVADKIIVTLTPKVCLILSKVPFACNLEV